MIKCANQSFFYFVGKGTKIRKYKNIFFVFSIRKSGKMYTYSGKKLRKHYVKILYTHLVGFRGCKQTYANIQKCLKHTGGGGGSRERKEYGANNPFRKIKILKKKKIKIFKNRKNQKLGFLRACACVKDENFVYFQMCDATKYQMMPFEPIFSPVERTNQENGIVIG